MGTEKNMVWKPRLKSGEFTLRMTGNQRTGCRLMSWEKGTLSSSEWGMGMEGKCSRSRKVQSLGGAQLEAQLFGRLNGKDHQSEASLCNILRYCLEFNTHTHTNKIANSRSPRWP